MATKKTTKKVVKKKTGPIEVGERISFYFEEGGNTVEGKATFAGLEGCGVILKDIEYKDKPASERLVNFDDVLWWVANRA